MSSEQDPHANAVAVVGAGCRLPGAGSLEEFWNNLCNGIVSIRQFTDEQLLAAGLPPQKLNDPRLVKAGAVIEDMEYFDAAFFGVTPGEAALLDPQHRVFLETTWTALENAGYDPQRFSAPLVCLLVPTFPAI